MTLSTRLAPRATKATRAPRELPDERQSQAQCAAGYGSPKAGEGLGRTRIPRTQIVGGRGLEIDSHFGAPFKFIKNVPYLLSRD
ncbi:MAG: hypothetical protein AUI36_12305 [Cyanobacteria bacterium 13_1_40CM_2_61_4]|nr:MAG: hypothetical protein AUI36_12305 [Cyanobacteria bacterium 13_1_40CM_2_61_4]